MGRSPPSVVLSYVREDEASLRALEKHLAPLRDGGKLAPWSARVLFPGEATAERIAEHLGAADVIVLLLSADYLASETAVREMAAALRTRRAADARVIPVLARPCFLDETPLGHLRALPENGEAISTSANADLAWLQVARAVRDIVASLSPGAGRGAGPGGGRAERLGPPLPRAPHFLGRDAQAG